MRNQKHFILIFGVFLLFFSGLFVSACQCDEGGLTLQEGLIKTSLPGEKRPNLIFTQVTVNKTNERSFTLWNEGSSPVTITAIKVVKQDFKLFAVKHPKLPLILAPNKGDKKTLTVLFTPKKAGEFNALLALTSSNADNVEEDGHFYIRLSNQDITPKPEFDCRKKLDFGSVALGKSVEKVCHITNTGHADLLIHQIEYKPEKNDKKAYEIVSPKEFPIKLPSGGRKRVALKIRFAPKNFPPAEAVGHMVLHTNIKNETDTNRYKIKVLGLIQVAVIQLVADYPECQSHEDCRRIDSRLFCTDDSFSGKKLCLTKDTVTPILKFPMTSKGSTVTKTFRIRSLGELPLQVTQINLGKGNKDFTVLNPGLPLTLDPKMVKEVKVSYRPSSSTPGKNTLLVTSNAGNQPRTPLALEASSHGCDLQVSARKFKFTGPKAFTFTLYNKGNQSCQIKSVKLKSGKDEPFALVPKPQPNTSIAPNGRLDMLVKFKPKGKQSAKDSILIESTDPDEPKIEIPLQGEVIGDRECELKSTSGILNFHLVAVGRSRQLHAGLTNVGWGDCVITSANVLNLTPTNSTAFRLSGTLPKTIKLAPRASLRVEVSFAPPQAHPSYTGKLVLASNDSKNPNFEVKLQGASGALCLEVIPQSMDFGSTKVGCATPKRTIEIYNLGTAGCQSPILLTGLKCKPSECFPKIPKAEFRINQAFPPSTSLNKGQVAKIEMSYKAADLGVDSHTLEIYNNVPGQSPVQIPLVGEGVDTDTQTDVFKQLDRPLTDILFVIDDSCSMGPIQSGLAKNFKDFIQWATRLKVDYHIAITTTDTDGRKAPAGCFRCGEQLCAAGHTKIITGTTPNAEAVFAKNVKVGIRGSGTERGLQAAFKALTAPALTGCNKGFYRKSASLSLIFVTDEKDHSTNTLQFYTSFFRSLKGIRNLDMIRASAVVWPPNTPKCPILTASASQGPRYWQLSKELRGARASICNSNWSATLSSIGSITFGYRTQYFLSRQADPKTIKVKVNGTTIKQGKQDGWQYEAVTNSINFSSSHIPPPSATIAVFYQAICLP